MGGSPDGGSFFLRCLRSEDPVAVGLAFVVLGSGSLGDVEIVLTVLGRCSGKGREAMGRPAEDDFPVTGSDLNCFAMAGGGIAFRCSDVWERLRFLVR